MKILIAEDDFVSRKLMNAYMEPYGQCEVVVNGKEAIDAFTIALVEKSPYDLICLDIMMPEMDGMEVLKEIRRIEDENGITGKNGAKILMTTAVDNPRNIMQAFKDQCEDYLIKPFDRSALENIVNKWFHKT